MATTNNNKRPQSLADQAMEVALMQSVLHPETVLDRSRPLPYAMLHDPEAVLKNLVQICDKDAWRNNGR